MNIEDYKKLTVADLKKELKARNLPVSGNKTELLQRLSDHISSNDEHQILDQSGRVDESLLEGVHEDEVLGISASAASTINNPPAPPKKTTLKKETSQAAAIIPAVKSVGETTGTVSKIPPAPQQVEGDTKNISGTEKEPEAKKIRLKPSISSEGDTSPKPATKISEASVDPDQAKIERAKRFNVPLTETDRKKLRAERFGTDAKSKGNAASVSSSKPIADSSTLEKRAQRFGASVAKVSNITSAGSTQDSEKLKQRAERFGLQSKTQGTNGVGKSGGDKETLLKRQLRFGSGSGSSGDDASDKKKARAERFGTGVTK